MVEFVGSVEKERENRNNLISSSILVFRLGNGTFLVTTMCLEWWWKYFTFQRQKEVVLNLSHVQ